MSVALAILHHDPHGRLAGLLEQVAPLLRRTFAGVAVRASTLAPQAALNIFAQGPALITRDEPRYRLTAPGNFNHSGYPPWCIKSLFPCSAV